MYCDVSTPDKAKDSFQAYNVKFGDLQNLQKFEEKVHEFQRSLDANKEAILALSILNNDIRKFSPGSDDRCWYRVDHALEKYRREINLQQSNIESFLKRISGRLQLVFSSLTIRFANERTDTQPFKLYNILDLKNSTTVSFYEQTKTEFDTISRKETERMTFMAEQTSKDAVSMKIITLVAMIYLPITFIAVSF